MAIPKEIKNKVVQEYLTGSTLTMLEDNALLCQTLIIQINSNNVN